MVFSDDKKTKFREAAGRALQLFAAYDNDFINSTKGFNRARVFKTYEMTYDDSSFIIDKALLEDSHWEAQKTLNSLRIEKSLDKTVNKAELVKRAKSILSVDQKARADTSSALATGEVDNYGFPLLNDKDLCNVLLSKMLRGLIKLNLVKLDSVSTWKKLIRLAWSGKLCVIL